MAHVGAVPVKVVTVFKQEVLFLLVSEGHRASIGVGLSRVAFLFGLPEAWRLLGRRLLRLVPFVVQGLVHERIVALVHVKVIEVLPLAQSVVAEYDDLFVLLAKLILAG